MLPILFAPLQGYTDYAYRNFHNEIFGGIDVYYTPFIRIEHGELRKKDVRDASFDNDETGKIIPQVIVKDVTELDFLVSRLVEMGHKRIDINMGCPFPLQTKKGRGAGLLSSPERVKEIMDYVNERGDVDFSLKMRLGNVDANECIELLPILNNTRLVHIVVHPRIATQQYKGDLNMEIFESFIKGCNKPVVFNGEIKSVEDICNLEKAYPTLAGIMVGRGLLSRPSMANEYKLGKSLSEKELYDKVMRFHENVFNHYSQQLQGDSHILMKMKTFWEYLESIIGHKQYKLVKKAVSVAKYNAALNI